MEAAIAGLRYGTPQARRVLLAAILGSGLAMLDATVVNIALPAIARDLRVGIATMQWTVTGYTLSLSALLLLGGSLGDRYGRRRVFLIGTAWFAISSVLCGLAPSGLALVVARIIQGIGAALLTPASLAILHATFHPDDRARAIGAWSGWGGVAVAIGPFVGGYLIDAISWRLIFLLNLPLAACVAWLARYIPETRDPSTPPLDWVGALLATVGLAGTTLALIEEPSLSRPALFGIGGCAAACWIAFAVVESRSRHPMLPMRLFQNPQFSGTNAVTLMVYGALSGVLFLLPIQLQQVLGYSALQSGVVLLPVTAMMLLLSPRAARLAQRTGPRLPMTVGPLIIATGLMLLGRVQAGTDFVGVLLPALLVFGLGLGITVAPLTATVLAAAPPEHVGVASAVNNAVARLAGLLAVAALPLATGLTGAAIARDPTRLSESFRTTTHLCAALCVLGAGLAFATIRRVAGPAPVAARFHCGIGAPPLERP